MIITTIYTPENKKEVKALQMMNINMQDAGMDVVMVDTLPGTDHPQTLHVSESRRARKSKQTAE